MDFRIIFFLFFVLFFLEELRIPEIAFEIYWPLVIHCAAFGIKSLFSLFLHNPGIIKPLSRYHTAGNFCIEPFKGAKLSAISFFVIELSSWNVLLISGNLPEVKEFFLSKLKVILSFYFLGLVAMAKSPHL